MAKKVLASLFVLALALAGCAGGGYGEETAGDEPVVVDETTTEEVVEETTEEVTEEVTEEATEEVAEETTEEVTE